MGKENAKKVNKGHPQEGYQPLRKGYQPTHSTINVSNPPTEGSGLTNGRNDSPSSGNGDSNTSSSSAAQSDKN